MMRAVATYPKIVTNDSLMETQAHGSNDFPFQYYLENVWAFDFHLMDWHWHPEVELLIVREGRLRCLIGGEVFELGQGEGLFINSRVIHRYEADADNLVPNIVFSPSLLAAEDSRIYAEYIRPLLGGVPFVRLQPDRAWQAEILQLLQDVFDRWDQERPNALKTARLLLQLWEVLFDNAEGLPADAEDHSHSVRLQTMMRYIHAHVCEPITLQQIASSAYISKSSAMQLFRENLHTSPIAYLIRYRLKCAAGLLAVTDKSVSAIAEETGFQSTGYFCRMFRTLYHCTPLEYRARNRK